MNKRTTLITQDVAKTIDIKSLGLESTQIISNSNKYPIKKTQQKQSPIYIYDLGFNKHNKIIPIKNHINKTGINSMRENPNKQIEFYDITKIYQNQNQAQIAECFGHHTPTPKTNNYIQTRFLCNHVVSLYCAGYTNIFAYVID